MSNKCQFVIDIKQVLHESITLNWVLNDLKCNATDTASLEKWLQNRGTFAVDTALNGISLYLAWYTLGDVHKAGVLALMRYIPHPFNRDQAQHPIPSEIEMSLLDYADLERNALEHRDASTQVQEQDILAITGHLPYKEYFVLSAVFAAGFSTFRTMPATQWIEGQLVNGVNNISKHIATIKGGTSQMSIITIINKTQATIIRDDDACYKGEKTVDFDRIDPADNFKKLPTSGGVGIFATTSNSFGGSASAVVIKLYQGSTELDRVVIAAADPISGRNTFLVAVNDNTAPKDLADKNDTKGEGRDYTEPQTVKLPKVNGQLRIRVEDKDKTFNKYCHVIASFEQTGVVIKD